MAGDADVDMAQESSSRSDMKAINEEYKIWKKNTPFLYDLVVTHALEWPSLTVQWLEKKRRYDDKDFSEHELLLGTHTSGGAQNHLLVARVKLPNEDTDIDARNYDDERGELGRYGGTEAKIDISVRINHDGEVNRARYMPQDDYVIGTKTVTGEVHVFNIRDHESTPAADSAAQPNIRCTGHEAEGYGLDWNPLTRGLLGSCSEDSTVCIWDTQGSNTTDKGALAPLHKFRAHEGAIGDLQWSRFHKDLFATVGDDGRLNMHDIRDLKTPTHTTAAHDAEVETLSFSPFNEFLMLTGGADNLVQLWDMRKVDNSLHKFRQHTGGILKVEWAPFNEAIMASCSADRRIMVWDLSRIGMEQSPEDMEDGPPELLFIHGGHTAKVSDFSWNVNDPWVISSVAEDNILQVWQMAENIYAEDVEDVAASAADAKENKVTDADLE